ncbi:MAG: BPL-N domain-containing protein, partial [Candidatus Thorarchaeota archaeon]
MDTRFVIMILLLSSVFLPGTITASDSDQSRFELATDLSGVRVAIFNGSTTEISTSCKNATKAMYEWMNATVVYINEDGIANNEIYGFDILVFPPGDLGEYSVKLRSEGKAKIREYIRLGGSFVGISRGAHFACEIADVYNVENRYGLNLFNGTGLGPVDGWLEQHMYVANINKSLVGLDLSGNP